MKRNNIFYKTKRNITLISTSIVFLCLFIFAIITQVLYSSRVLSNIDRQLIKRKSIFEMTPQPHNKPLNDFMLNYKRGNGVPVPPNIILAIYNNGELTFLSPNAYFYDEVELPIFPKGSEGKIVNLEAATYNFRGISLNDGNNNIQFFINIDSEMGSIKQLTTSLIIGLVVLIIIALGLSTFLAAKIMRPVKDAYDKQVFFVQDASHEMRTPLAVIKGKVEILANSYNDTIETHFEKISKIMSEIKGLEKLNSDLLLLSKEDIDSSIIITDINLNNFIEEISSFYEDLAEIKEKNFSVVKANESVTVKWDYIKVKRMVVILLENAFKYTKANDSIELVVENLNKNVKVIVRDTGIGIKEEDKNRIFDRFFRSDDVRGRNINGSGIGLSLLKSIGNTLGIKISLSSEVGKGSEFVLVIPKEIT